MTTSRQGNDELAVFKKFVRQYPCPVEDTTIQKKEPPLPDIFCTTQDGEGVFFELTECVDGVIPKSLYNKVNFEKKFREYHEGSVNREPFQKKYSNALIYVYFNDGSSGRQRFAQIPAIYDFLFNLKDGLENKAIPDDADLKKTVKWISIKRAGFVGPCFDSSAFCAFGEDELFETSKEKFSKRYETSGHPIEVLTYFDVQPEILGGALNDFEGFVKANISRSGFRRVWVYSFHQDKVLFCHP